MRSFSNHIRVYILVRRQTLSPFVGDSPFAEGKSTNGSISSTNTDSGARIPFRRGNASSCILENIYVYLHYILTLNYAWRNYVCANFLRERRVLVEMSYFFLKQIASYRV